MQRLRYRNFSQGWWPMGDRAEMPPNTLRRAVGVHAIKTGTLRSRWGATALYALSAHSLYRFADVRFQGVAQQLDRNGLFLVGHLSGNRLRFMRMPPSPGSVDYLFVAGGGRLFKVSPGGVVSQWGIVAPSIDFTAEVLANPADGMTVTPGIAGPLTGTFNYVVTFRVTATGLESGPNPTPVVAAPAAQQDDVAAIPTGTGAVDSRRLYRTKDGGTDYFLLTTIADNVTVTFTDTTLDANLGTTPFTTLNGTYKYRVTFKNSVTGSRSNANPNAVTVAPANQPVLLKDIPISPDPQVDSREIWRTAAGLDVFFLLTTIPNNSETLFLDTIPDVNLQTVELPLDNDPPEATFQDTAGPYVGRAWWARDTSEGDGGRVFFSPVGRPEALGGFIEINNGDDPTQRLVFWGGVLYCFTNGKIIQILGTDEPFTFNEVFGAPGTTAPFSVVPSPWGIFYQATDGLRLFDGAKSSLIGFDAIGRLLQGEDLEGVPPFRAIVAEYAGREVWFSDEATTLVVDPNNGTWRIAAGGVTALYYEPDTELLVGSFAGSVNIMEPPQVVLDAGTAIPFEVETPGRLTDITAEGLVARLYFEVDTAGQLLTPTLVLDDDEVVLPPFTTVGRPLHAIEYAVGRWGRVVGVRLTGSLIRQVTIYGIDIDVYVPTGDATSTLPAEVTA